MEFYKALVMLSIAKYSMTILRNFNLRGSFKIFLKEAFKYAIVTKQAENFTRFA